MLVCGGVVLKELAARIGTRVRGWRDKEIDREPRREAQEERIDKAESGQGFATSRAERALRRHTDPCRPHAYAKQRRAAT